MEQAGKPRVLFVYYSYTRQALTISETMAAVFRDRGWHVDLAAIELTDARYSARFSRFPLKHAYFDVIAMLGPQLRRATGEIRIPAVVESGTYDLVCIGSPTWWLTTCLPIRSFLTSAAAARLLDGRPVATFVVCRRYWRNNARTVKRLAAQRGGHVLDTTHFVFAGGQVHSLLALVSYLGSGENRARYLGIKIPSANLQPGYADAARAFAGRLADRLGVARSSARKPPDPERERRRFERQFVDSGLSASAGAVSLLTNSTIAR